MWDPLIEYTYFSIVLTIPGLGANHVCGMDLGLSWLVSLANLLKLSIFFRKSLALTFLSY